MGKRFSSYDATFKVSSSESRYDATGRRDLIKGTAVILEGLRLILLRKLAHNGDA